MQDRSVWQRFWAHLRRDPKALVSACILIVLIVAAVCAPYLSPYDPRRVNVRAALQPPSSTHWMGTDLLGRDVFSRVLYGARISLGISLAAVLVGAVVGTLLGMIAGYAGGRVEQALMRTVDVLLAFPEIVAAIFILAFFGPSLTNVIIAIAAGRLPVSIRIAHAETLAVKGKEYLEAAHAIGAPPARIIGQHILRNILPPIMVYLTFSIPLAILIEAGLGFLGLGAPPSVPSWGRIINSGRDVLLTAPWISIIPGLIIGVTVLAFNLCGEAIVTFLDPKAQRNPRR